MKINFIKWILNYKRLNKDYIELLEYQRKCLNDVKFLRKRLNNLKTLFNKELNNLNKIIKNKDEEINKLHEIISIKSKDLNKILENLNIWNLNWYSTSSYYDKEKIQELIKFIEDRN